MTTAENSLLYFEIGQSLVSMAAQVDAGDHKTFNSAAEPDPKNPRMKAAIIIILPIAWSPLHIIS